MKWAGAARRRGRAAGAREGNAATPMRYWALVSALPLAAVLTACTAAPAGAASALPPQAAKVARDFLRAFVSNDRDAISRMLPADLTLRYGPSPFGRMPRLFRPRAEKRVGARQVVVGVELLRKCRR